LKKALPIFFRRAGRRFRQTAVDSFNHRALSRAICVETLFGERGGEEGRFKGLDAATGLDASKILS